MGILEKEAKSQRKKAYIQKIILASLATAGIMSLAVLAPNAMQVLHMLDGGKRRKKNPKYVVDTTIGRLLDQKLIHFEKSEKGTFVRLTEKGRGKLRELTRGDVVVKKPKRWDKRWRLVIFDIKEHRKYTRDKLRDTLIRLGFLRLQNSVWVFPYDCEDLIVLLKADFEIGKDVLYIIADKVENDVYLKDYFGLA